MHICPCVYCRVDVAAGRGPLFVAHWRSDGTYWRSYLRGPGDQKRNRAAVFGPRHALVIRANPHFVVEEVRLRGRKTTPWRPDLEARVGTDGRITLFRIGSSEAVWTP